MIQPAFLLINKEYQNLLPDQDSRQSFVAAVSQLARHLRVGHPDSTATMHDDIAVWFRNLFFLKDPRFEAALGDYKNDLTLMARAWRIHNLCWALSQAAHVRGDIVDAGCYDGKTTHIYCEYNAELIKYKMLHMFDYFDAPPGDHKKAGHGADLAKQVEARLADFQPMIFEGSVTETIPAQLPDEICFAHVDLNSAEAEAHVMPEIYERMPSGAMIVFDDYGFARYRESALVHQKFLADKMESILELPTGQGLMVKR